MVELSKKKVKKKVSKKKSVSHKKNSTNHTVQTIKKETHALHHTCTNCSAKKTKKFWFYEEGSILCDTCNKKLGHIIQEHIDKEKIHRYTSYFWTTFAIAMFLILIMAIIAPFSIITLQKTQQLESAYIKTYNELLETEDKLLTYEIFAKNVANELHIAKLPPYKTIDKENITFSFLVNNNKVDWTFPREIIQYKTNSQNKPLHTFTLNDKTFSVIDLREYVIPDSFIGKMEPLIEGKDEKDIISTIQHITMQFMTYELEVIDTPKIPLETMVDGVGDCDDSAILFASLLKATRPDWLLAFMYVDSKNPLYPQNINHVMVLVTTDTTDYIIETTSRRNYFITEEYTAEYVRI